MAMPQASQCDQDCVNRAISATALRAVCRSITGCGHCERCRWYQSGGKDSYVILPADERFPNFTVSTQYVAKHQPKAGGYFVVYEDGYESFSPAESFESGYSLIAP